MKKSTAITLAIATTLVTGSAFAASTKKPTKKPAADQNVTLESTPSTAPSSAPAAAPAPAQPAPATAAVQPAPGVAAAPQSVVANEQASDKLIDKLQLQLISLYVGPAISKFDRNTPNQQGAPDGLQHFENSLRFGYKLSSDISLSVSYEHFIYPATGFDITNQDPYARIADGKILNIGDFSWSGDFRYYAPTTTTSQVKGQIAQLRTNHTFGYTLGRWTFGTYGTIRRYVYNTESQVNIVNGKEVGVERRAWRAYIGPYVNLQLTPKLALTALYEAEGIQFESHKWNDWGSNGTDFELGFNYDFTPKISLNPFIQIYPHADKINADNTLIGALLVASFL